MDANLNTEVKRKLLIVLFGDGDGDVVASIKCTCLASFGLESPCQNYLRISHTMFTIKR